MIIPDRDNYRRWYVDKDYIFDLPDGHIAIVRKGYRFDGHSTGIFKWLFPKYNERDIKAAMIHDYLIDTMPWHRFSRKYIDDIYHHYMQEYSYGQRQYWMPLAVYVWGYIKTRGWRDYRGEVKPHTVIDVQVTMV